MLNYLARRIVYTLPILLGVALLCFALVHLAPGDPLVSVLPPDASVDLQQQLRALLLHVDELSGVGHNGNSTCGKHMRPKLR